MAAREAAAATTTPAAAAAAAAASAVDGTAQAGGLASINYSQLDTSGAFPHDLGYGDGELDGYAGPAGMADMKPRILLMGLRRCAAGHPAGRGTRRR